MGMTNYDCISRQAVLERLKREEKILYTPTGMNYLINSIKALPPVKPQYTEAEIQKMQEMEQAEIQKSYELGKAEMQSSDDAISRQAVHDLFAMWLSDYLTDETREALETIDYKIEDLPSVTPQPKMGRWIDEPYYKISEYGEEDTYYTRKCSECFEKYDVAFNYCPNCGCRMIESEDKEDM